MIVLVFNYTFYEINSRHSLFGHALEVHQSLAAFVFANASYRKER